MKKLIILLAVVSLVGAVSAGSYLGSGDWFDVDPSDGIGWKEGVLPGAYDLVRINDDGNTVTLAGVAPDINQFQFGVDESGALHILSGGTLTTIDGNNKIGNNGYCTGGMIIDAGGTVNSTGWLMIAGNSTVTGVATVAGTLNSANHLWMATGTDATATLNINAGGVVDVGGMIGLGTVNAVSPSGGIATLNVNEGGLLVLSNIHSGIMNNPPTGNSIQPGSVINISGSGMVTLPGDFVNVINKYAANGSFAGDGVAGAVDVVYDAVADLTEITSLEPIPGNGDVNGDGIIDGTDLLLFVAQWLEPTPDPDADFTGDGKVDNADFAILAANWLTDNNYSDTLTGKIMCGYQGWFNTPTDGAGRGWVHWGSSNRFEPGYCTVDWWPDMSEYDADEKYVTGFQYADTSTAHVFSSFNNKTVLRHFSWMEEYGIDGVFLQRFATETTPGSAARNHRDMVMLHCQEGGNLYQRSWAMMYDLSGLGSGSDIQKVEDDWKYLVDTFGISQDPTDLAYLHHNGQPVVAIWGLGFERSYEGQESYELIYFLKNDPTYGGCTVMLGVNDNWRTNLDYWFQQTVQLADIISPWAVGRYGSIYTSELDNFTNNVTMPDKAWCDANGKEYLPVVFPGFSWQNLKGEKWDHIPRRGGSFLWRQYYKAINDGGVTMIYQAMFDEVDEGTAIFKCTSTPPVAEEPYVVPSTPFLPTGNAQYAPYDPSDASLPSDEYLWLVGQGRRMLNGEIPLSETRPTR